VLFKFRKAQKDLNNHLKSKKDVLEQILNNIEGARKSQKKLLFYKQTLKIILRVVLVGLLITVNGFYVKHYYPDEWNIPNILSTITDLNAILALVVSCFVFLRYGSFLELSKVFDNVQNVILQEFFRKKEELIETLLQTNLESKDAIQKEIKETEDAINQNEELFMFHQTDVVVFDNKEVS
jgi:hypothetical protein